VPIRTISGDAWGIAYAPNSPMGSADKTALNLALYTPVHIPDFTPANPHVALKEGNARS